MKSLKASMEGEWFGLTCGYVCARLLSAKTLTSRGSPWWILGSWLSDSLRILRQMKSVTFEQSSPNVWGEEKKREREREKEGGKKKTAICCFFPWSRFPPTPSLESLPQIAFAQAFITRLKLCYCSWHSKWTTTNAKQFISAFSSGRVYGKKKNKV